MSRLLLRTRIETWPMRSPFAIAGLTLEAVDLLVVELEKEGVVGYGEAAGVFYRGETAATIQNQVESVRARIESGCSIEQLQEILPPGGARNALDCAFWSLMARSVQRPVWQLLGMPPPHPVTTTFTCGLGTPEEVRDKALAFAGARAIKLKMAGDGADMDRVRLVRAALPNVWLCVDANQAWSAAMLEEAMPELTAADIALVEQPFPIGADDLLPTTPIGLAADESVQHAGDLAGLSERYTAINVKLDKAGGLTGALEMVRAARKAGLMTMVGALGGTSLGMAPAFLVGQLCDIVDLDGPALLARDRRTAVDYEGGTIDFSYANWAAD